MSWRSVMKGLTKGFNLVISLGCILALIIIVITQFVLNDVPEYFRGGANLGNVLFNISMSYLVSYIFYVIVAYLPEENKKTYVRKHVDALVKDIIKYNNTLKDNMKRQTGNTANMNNDTDIINVMSQIQTNATAPIVAFVSGISSFNWKEYLELNNNQVVNKCNGLFVYMPYLDPELVQLLSDLIYSKYFNQLDLLRGVPTNPRTTIGYLSTTYVVYNNVITKIEEYTSKA
ncbi:hypothetical protein [Paenibacillus piscarius]|uniref:hypothetical protein n=1 Tax=Paenibacillus piscarius TaxID=1089681 RepID=UPI001EE86EC2|nr:hypothetical protein [Paenibacillus piscarius]